MMLIQICIDSLWYTEGEIFKTFNILNIQRFPFKLSEWEIFVMQF